MRTTFIMIAALALSACASRTEVADAPVNAPIEAVVQSEAARQTAAAAASSGAPPDRALEKAAKAEPPNR